MFWSGEQWRIFSTLTLDERIAKRFMGQSGDGSIVQLAFSKIQVTAAVLDTHLAERQFIVVDHLTLADIDIVAPLSQPARTNVPFSEFPNLVAWQQRLLDTVPTWSETKREVDERIDSVLTHAGIEL